MKNHIIFKFIAIILCAASLMGAVSSILGIVVLTEGDLYNKTVDQMVQTQLEDDVHDYATWLARNYSSTELGGCSDNLVYAQYGGHWFDYEYDPAYYGYAILDAEGNELLSYNADVKDGAALYTNSISGKYIHLVSAETESEIQARNAELQAAAYDGDVLTDGDGERIPAEGIAVNHVFFTDADGRILYEAYCDAYGGVGSSTYHYYESGNPGSYYTSSYDHDGHRTGFLFYNQAGQLVYNSFLEEYEEGFTATVYGVYFVSETTGLTFQLDNPEGLGIVSTDNRSLIFVSYPVKTAAEETEPVTEPTIAEETVPESIPETVPQEVIDATEVVETVPEIVLDENGNPVETTAPAETWETTPVETWQETIPSAASAVPEETYVTEAVTEPLTTEAMEATEVTESTAVETLPQETVPEETVPAETVPEETVPEVTEPVLINGKPLGDYQLNHAVYYDSELQEDVSAYFVYVPMPELMVEVYVADGALRNASSYEALEVVRQYRNYLLPAVGICLLIFAVFTVYLCTAAGRKPGTAEVKAGGLNRMPLDVYLFGGGFAIACIALGLEFVDSMLQRDFMLGFGFAAVIIFLCCLIFVGFCFAFVAQIKTPGGFWWRNTLCGICIRHFIRFACWLETVLSTKGYPFLGRLFKKLWQFTRKSVVWLYHATENSVYWVCSKLGILFRWIGNKLNRFFSLLPMTWQWLVVALVIILCALLVNARSTFLVLLGILIPIAIILYASHCFGILAESTKRMSKGDLDTKVDDTLLLGCFKDFSADLSDLAGVAVVAAQKQLKSERMKTELITNVSHDIKTPLTSIINYVDLLQKPHTDEEEAQYLEVLDRQSQRLKKLIDDLMDMSKASTGNMAVEITKVDAVESVNQALGEFADKLDRAQLIPVFRHTDERVPMMADGKLVWRVMSNLLSNAVKYAMPGTRLYIDLITMEGKVVISLKNISREELNVDADELMERFVRGDDSRNTEGSGLGLNIARNLMELQKGQLQLLVDGDLFKVTLIFPGA